MSRAVLCTFLMALAAPLSLGATETPETMFRTANEAYREGRYSEAAEAYRSILDLGVRDARVEYNLGNAVYKTGRLGEAILHYERARRLDPADEEILANLEIARDRTLDRIEGPEVGALVGTVRRAQERVGADGQFAVFLGLIWVLAAIVVLFSLRRAGWPAWGGWLTAGVVAAAIVVAASWWATWARLEGTPRAIVLDAALEVLAGPGENNAVLFTVHEGASLEIRSERGAWLQVSLPNGLNGWVPEEAVGRV